MIAQRVGVSASSVYSWTKELREQKKQERDAEIARLREEGMTQQEIADEVGVERMAQSLLKCWKIPKLEKSNKEPESEAEPAIEADEEETGEEVGCGRARTPEPGLEAPEPDEQPEHPESLA